jgi:ABC-type nitrate/sulfonate/bicarbonate transport system substrate-binding protein
MSDAYLDELPKAHVCYLRHTDCARYQSGAAIQREDKVTMGPMPSSAPTTKLRVCTFRGLQNLPLYAAARLGRFAARALDVELSYTTGSSAQIAGLARGEYELIQTAPDNVIAAHGDPAAFALDPATRLVMVLGGSVGPLSIYAQPNITTPAALRGATIGVDNPGSGFALVLRDLLARANLTLERDYTFTVSGGTSARLDALRRGAVAATLFYAPYDAQAEADGFFRLATSTARYSAYASLATAGLHAWIAAHSDETVRYIASMLEALRWIFAPDHAVAVRAILRDEPALALDEATATAAYRAFVAPGTGFGVSAALDVAGLEQVIALRGRYGAGNPAPATTEQYDPYWYDRARALVG